MAVCVIDRSLAESEIFTQLLESRQQILCCLIQQPNVARRAEPVSGATVNVVRLMYLPQQHGARHDLVHKVSLATIVHTECPRVFITGAAQHGLEQQVSVRQQPPLRCVSSASR